MCTLGFAEQWDLPCVLRRRQKVNHASTSARRTRKQCMCAFVWPAICTIVHNKISVQLMIDLGRAHIDGVNRVSVYRCLVVFASDIDLVWQVWSTEIHSGMFLLCLRWFHVEMLRCGWFLQKLRSGWIHTNFRMCNPWGLRAQFGRTIRTTYKSW